MSKYFSDVSKLQSVKDEQAIMVECPDGKVRKVTPEDKCYKTYVRDNDG